jgi:hypothetical protein
MTPLMRKILSVYPDNPPEDFKWFDMTGMMPEKGNQMMLDDVEHGHLPFPRCCLIGTDSNGNEYCLFVVENLDERFRWGATGIVFRQGWMENGNRVLYRIPPIRFDIKSRSLEMPKENQNMDLISVTVATIAIFVKALERMPVTAHVPTLVNTFTNKRKLAQGKPATYTWTTLDIDPRPIVYPKEHKGGTHASPRFHARRGHWRTTKLGKRVWVKNCSVGNAALGTAFHDYRLVREERAQ